MGLQPTWSIFDWALFIFMIFGVISNMVRAKEMPTGSVFLGALWSAVSTMAWFNVKPF